MRRRPGHRRRSATLLERGDAAGARADEQAHRGRRHARLPVRRRGAFTRPGRRRRSCSTTTGREVVAGGARRARRRSTTGTTARSRQALREALVEELGLKPRNAFGPVRVAVTGRRVSPPLFESLELLGRERSLRAACRRPWHDPPGRPAPGARSPRTDCRTTGSSEAGRPGVVAAGGRASVLRAWSARARRRRCSWPAAVLARRYAVTGRGRRRRHHRGWPTSTHPTPGRAGVPQPRAGRR